MSEYLLVHGAWDSGWVWQGLAERLEKAGHRVTVVDQLPSAGPDPSSLGDLTSDAQHVRRILDDLDGPVVLVGHSYGGMVITELADHPKVRHSVYLAAFLPQRVREFRSHAVLQSAAAFGVPSTGPERRHPTTFIITTQESDNSLPVAFQEAMAANADNVVRLPAPHMAQLCRPDELAEALGRI